MRLQVARPWTPFRVAGAVASLCAVAAVVVVLLPVPKPDEQYSYDSEGVLRFQAASAAAFVVLALWLRRRQEAAAFGLLVGACLLAGWTVDSLWRASGGADEPAFVLALLSSLAMVAAPTAVISAFAATPARRLDRRGSLLLGSFVLATVLGAFVETVGAIQAWSGGARGFDLTFTARGFTQGFSFIAPAVALVTAILGSLRREALAFEPAPPRARRPAPMSAALRTTFAVAALAGAASAGRWALSGPERPGELMLPLLVTLIAFVAARWSAYLATGALAISFALVAGMVFAAGFEVAVTEILARPEGTWTPGATLLLPSAGALTLALFGLAMATSSVREARDSIPGRRVRVTPSLAVLVGIALACVVLSWLPWLISRFPGSYPLLEAPFWLGVAIFGVTIAVLGVGAAEAVRGRLVPAISEAEIVARRPLRPFRYLETVALEAIGGRAGVRRAAVEEERSRLASDLHAELLPSLAEIKAQAEAGAPHEAVARRLRRLEDEIRDLMADRRLVILEEFGLVEAIEWLLGRAEERASVDVELSVDDRTTASRPPRDVERAAFRIAQLAVENAIQHASPTRLDLDVLVRADEVRLSVSDDGTGIAVPADRSRDHMGIADMRGRAADVRGDVQVVTPPAGGTTVTFAWPAA